MSLPKSLQFFGINSSCRFPCAIFSRFFDIQFVEIRVKRLIDLHFVAGQVFRATFGSDFVSSDASAT